MVTIWLASFLLVSASSVVFDLSSMLGLGLLSRGNGGFTIFLGLECREAASTREYLVLLQKQCMPPGRIFCVVSVLDRSMSYVSGRICTVNVFFVGGGIRSL